MGICLPLSFFLFAAGPASAAAPPACKGQISQKTLYEGQGKLESLAIGGGGRLYVSGTDGTGNAAVLRQYAKPGSPARVVATADPGAGGLAWQRRQLLWGNGNTTENGKKGDDDPVASLLLVNPAKGTSRPFAQGLGMANGVVRAASGGIFASNDMGMKLDRISPSGQVNHGWASVESANGLTISPNGRFLFASQTLVSPSSIARIEIARPANVTTWFKADVGHVLDGLTRDKKGNLYAAAWLSGSVWKIDRNRRACVLATGIPQVSNLAFGMSRKGFSNARLYAVNFAGQIVAISGARKARVPAS